MLSFFWNSNVQAYCLMLWYIKSIRQPCPWHKKTKPSYAFNKRDTNVRLSHYACSNCRFRWEVRQPQVMNGLVFFRCYRQGCTVANQSSWNLHGALAHGVKAGEMLVVDGCGRLTKCCKDSRIPSDIPEAPLLCYNDRKNTPSTKIIHKLKITRCSVFVGAENQNWLVGVFCIF